MKNSLEILSFSLPKSNIFYLAIYLWLDLHEYLKKKRAPAAVWYVSRKKIIHVFLIV